MVSLQLLKSYEGDAYNCIFILAIKTLSAEPAKVICLRSATDTFRDIFHSFVLPSDLILLSLNH